MAPRGARLASILLIIPMATDGNGKFVLPLDLPDNSILVGQKLYMQYLEVRDEPLPQSLEPPR